MCCKQSASSVSYRSTRYATSPAHIHILWSRNTGYREDMLWPLLRQRALFEHFTHDAWVR